MTEDEKQFLLSLVDDIDSDYDDELDGVANFWVDRDLLYIKFWNANTDQLTEGYWRLTYVPNEDV